MHGLTFPELAFCTGSIAPLTYEDPRFTVYIEDPEVAPLSTKIITFLVCTPAPGISVARVVPAARHRAREGLQLKCRKRLKSMDFGIDGISYF